MHIEKIRMRNFRNFIDTEIPLDKHFNVLIGDNGTGKTAVLDALAIAMSTYLLGVDGQNVKTITDKDVRIVAYPDNKEEQYPVEIVAQGIVGGTKLTWSRFRTSKKKYTGAGGDVAALKFTSKSHLFHVQKNLPVKLPVFSYYGTGRLWKEKKDTLKTRPKSSRYDGYIYSTDPESTTHHFLQKMKTWQLGVLQKTISSTPLDVVTATVRHFLDEHLSIYFDVVEDTLMLIDLREDAEGRKKVTPWYALSDGYRNVIAMAADLAYKCITLNPHLGEEATTKATGIVLIDELDLHLHPSWQRRVVNSFKSAFPNLQFVTTTHSPFIIQSLKNHELYDLQGKDVGQDYINMSLEDIVEAEMGLEGMLRSERFQQMQKAAEEYFNLLQKDSHFIADETLQAAKQRLDELELAFNEDPAYVALMKAERKTS